MHKLGYKIENKKNLKNRFMSYLTKFNCTKNINLLFRARIFVKKIDEFFPGLQIEDHKDGCIFIFSNLNIYVETPEEIFIISEVFVDNDYYFLNNDKCVVIDVGANVGISSLFFSTLPFVEKIYTFEPVPDTYKQAEYNFNLNKTISKVVQHNNFGLGKNNRPEVFIFNKEMKGNTGVRGLLSPSYALSSKDFMEVEVAICDASEKISIIKNENSGMKIVVKMDCEGAEYEIFENLAHSKCIDSIDVFMIEWHDKGSEAIEKTLQNANFNCFSRSLGPRSGMIYAYKN